VNPLATVRIEWHEDVPVARVMGEIDASNVVEVGDSLRGLVTNQSRCLVVDLSDTQYLDSAGINLLFAIGEELRSRQVGLRLVVVPTSPIARMLSITSLDRAFPTHGTLPDALDG
jgi:anti-anti-sigma factor